MYTGGDEEAPEIEMPKEDPFEHANMTGVAG